MLLTIPQSPHVLGTMFHLQPRGFVWVWVFGVTLILNISLLLPDMSCRSRLATLNEKLTALERRIEYIEARVTKGETLT